MKKVEIVVNKSDRVLKVLEKQCPAIIYSAFTCALRQKDIIVNDNRIKENVVVNSGDRVTVFVADNAFKKDPFKIVYQDSNVVFVEKGRGIETCDGEYNVQTELIKQGINVFAVHRLDRNTLGLVIFAKNIQTQKELIKQFKQGNVEKWYYAEVCGKVESHKKLHGYLTKNKEESTVKIYNNKVAGGEEILTEYTTIKTNGNVSLLQVKIKDGKTHQIRAHLAFNKIYIIGDGKYGKNEINSKYKAKTQHLKAYKICFNIPDTSFLNYLNNIKVELDEKF